MGESDESDESDESVVSDESDETDGSDESDGLDGLTGLVGPVHGLSHSLPHTLPMVLSAETLSHACVLILRKCGCSWQLPHTDDRIAALTHIPVAKSDSLSL